MGMFPKRCYTVHQMQQFDRCLISQGEAGVIVSVWGEVLTLCNYLLNGCNYQRATESDEMRISGHRCFLLGANSGVRPELVWSQIGVGLTEIIREGNR